MPELFLEPSPQLSTSMPFEGWRDYVTNRDNHHIERDRARVFDIQRTMTQGSGLEWVVDRQRPVQVMAKGQNDSPESKNPLIGYGMVGKRFEEARRIDSGTHSGAQGVHVIGKYTGELRHERHEAQKERHRHKKYESFREMLNNERQATLAAGRWN